MIVDLFGNNVEYNEVEYVNIYADEIQQVKNIVTGEEWLYTAAIYEKINKPVLPDLINYRYRKDLQNWENYVDQNNENVHWVDIRGNKNKKYIIDRWLDYILKDCDPNKRNFNFSILGINTSNLNLDEFGENQVFNNIYNRFFRSMLQFSLKKFFNRGVVVKSIYHEDGQQSTHSYFNWHTVLKLDYDEDLNFCCDSIEFLPKSHRDDKRSNVIQLCDVLLGIFKDLHLGVEKNYCLDKKDIISSRFTQELLIKRIIREPNNKNSSYGYSNRFHVSLFPKIKSDPGSIVRSMNNYYDISKIDLSYEYNLNQCKLIL